MKTKTLIILLVICLVLAGITYLVFKPEKNTNGSFAKEGEKLLAGLDVNKAVTLEIITKDGSVNLKKGPEYWEVETRYGYPADFSKITKFVKKLKNMKIGRWFKAGDDVLSRLALYDPGKKDAKDDQKGTRIILKDKDGKILADLILGKARESSAGFGGHYIIKNGDSVIYLVDKDFKFMDKEAPDWLKKELLKVNSGKIEKVTAFDPEKEKPLFIVKRSAKGKKAVFENLPEGKKQKDSKIKSLMGALSSLRINDVADPDSPDDKTGLNGPYLEYHLFDGTVYRVSAGKKVSDDDTSVFFKVSVRYEPQADGKDAGDSHSKENKDEKEKSGKKDPRAVKSAAKDLNKKLGKWIYVIAGWKADNMSTNPDSYLEDIKPEKKDEKPEGKNNAEN